MADRITRRLHVTGRVQGVFFRDWTVRTAQELGLAGWVRNRSDGSVEAVASGAADRIETFVQRCHQGPERARVDRIIVSDMEDQELDGFERRPDG